MCECIVVYNCIKLGKEYSLFRNKTIRDKTEYFSQIQDVDIYI